jgi:hypothetical protein
MLTHRMQAADQPGFMQLTDVRTGRVRLVFVGDAVSRLGDKEIRTLPEAPSLKWAAVIAA